jgi:nucleotidyltransferase/DNA polymerase involved in DNA repair
MDHFYTAVEERLHPELKGRPVIVRARLVRTRLARLYLFPQLSYAALLSKALRKARAEMNPNAW